MDLAKSIEFLFQYPAWYRFLVVIWIIVGAVLLGGLVVLKPDSRPLQSVATIDSPPIEKPPIISPLLLPESLAQPKTSFEVQLTAQEYFTRLQSISDRFLEKQEFVENNTGKTVVWMGMVDSVSQRSTFISLHLTIQGITPEGTVFVSLPDQLRTKAFSLRKGDIVQVNGKLSLSTPSMPDLDGAELILMKSR